MKNINAIIYGVLGAIALVYGVANLLFPAILVKEAARSFPLAHLEGTSRRRYLYRMHGALVYLQLRTKSRRSLFLTYLRFSLGGNSLASGSGSRAHPHLNFL